MKKPPCAGLCPAYTKRHKVRACKHGGVVKVVADGKEVWYCMKHYVKEKKACSENAN